VLFAWHTAIARRLTIAGAGYLGQRGEGLAELDDLVQLIAEFFDSCYGDNDGVTAAINLLDDSQETTSRVLSQVKREMFPLDSDIIIQ
jgi:hypothetical protein